MEIFQGRDQPELSIFSPRQDAIYQIKEDPNCSPLTLQTYEIKSQGEVRRRKRVRDNQIRQTVKTAQNDLS